MKTALGFTLFLINAFKSAAPAGFSETNEAFPLPTHQQGLE